VGETEEEKGFFFENSIQTCVYQPSSFPVVVGVTWYSLLVLKIINSRSIIFFFLFSKEERKKSVPWISFYSPLLFFMLFLRVLQMVCDTLPLGETTRIFLHLQIFSNKKTKKEWRLFFSFLIFLQFCQSEKTRAWNFSFISLCPSPL
jgi:hypothetical protein